MIDTGPLKFYVIIKLVNMIFKKTISRLCHNPESNRFIKANPIDLEEIGHYKHELKTERVTYSILISKCYSKVI